MNVSVSHHPPGVVTGALVPGDIGLVRDWVESKLGQMIQAGERVDFAHNAWANFTHTFGIVSAAGGIVEANEAGVQRKNISRYRDADLYIVHPEPSIGVTHVDELRRYAVRFLEAQVGTSYDILDFVALAFQALFGVDVSLHSGRRFICSGLVCRATECYTLDGYPKAPESMKPADIAAYYGVTMHEAPYPLGPFARFLDLAATFGHVLRAIL